MPSPPHTPSILRRIGQLWFVVTMCASSSAPAQDVLWQRDGELSTSHFGSAVYPLGDQNDDGYADWAVYNGDEDDWSPWLSGLDFFYGGDPADTTPYLSFRGEEGNPPVSIRQFKFADFNGDGFIDWMFVYYPFETDTGYIKFFSGGIQSDTIPEVAWTMSGFFNQNNTRGEVGLIGDHNGDGYDDFYYYDSRPSDLTTIYLGNPTWDFQVAYVTQGEPIFSGESRPGGVFGDINGDGFDDYATSGGDQHVTKFYFGSAEPDTVPDMIWQGGFYSLSTWSQDLNSDGFDDIAVPRAETSIDIHWGADTLSETPTGTLQYGACTSGTVTRLWPAKDFNGDNYEDLVVVDYACNSGFGRIALFVGGPYLRSTPVWEENGTVNGLMVGIYCAVGVGDVNNDGIDDLAVGCQNGFNRRGRVVIFSGDTTLILPAEEHQPIVDDFSLSAFPNPFNSTLSITLDIPLHQEISLSLFDILGREAAVIHRGRLNSTTLNYTTPATLSSGIYFLRAATNTNSTMQKVVLLK